MKLKPKYSGEVSETTEPCFCKKNRGTVWYWKPPVEGSDMGMAAHTKCFRRLWKGEN